MFVIVDIFVDCFIAKPQHRVQMSHVFLFAYLYASARVCVCVCHILFVRRAALFSAIKQKLNVISKKYFSIQIFYRMKLCANTTISHAFYLHLLLNMAIFIYIRIGPFAYTLYAITNTTAM